MTTTYDSTLPDNRNHVRFLLQDVDTPFHFQDEEIDAVLADESATGAATKYYAAATLLNVLASSIAVARGPGNVREKRVSRLTLIWGVDRDTLDALNARISWLRQRGGGLLATKSKVFRVLPAGNRIAYPHS